MAVFEYSGLLVSSGKQVKGVRDADNPKVLRAVLKREGILLTNAHEDTKAASLTPTAAAPVAPPSPAAATPFSTIQNQEDAPPCSTCGSIMIRSGACYKCSNCGNTSGCA